jgi:N-acetylglucosaminyldiphosphoundecaprenol N-acetyl-beta-D-mannosaminyltransferase
MLALLLVVLIKVTFVLKIIITVLVVLPALAFLYVLLRLMKPANPPADLAPAINLLGIRVDRVTMEEAMQRVEGFIREDVPHMIFTGDATGLMKAQDDPELHRIINEADLVTADGAGVVLSSRLLNQPLNERVSGCDMVGEICKVAARMGRSVYLLGAAPGVADKAAENLQQMAPGLQIAGCHDGYFKPEDEAALVAEIAALKPAALFVALGIPRQEKFIKQHMEALGVPVCIGIGGSFDVISGLKKRAPRWMQRTGLEWLYRVSKEPSRLPRLTALPRIVIMSFRELLRAPEQEG